MQFLTKVSTIAIMALTSVALQGQAPPAAPRPPQPPPILHTIKDGKLYWIEAPVPNVGFVIGDTGVILIDDGFANIADIVARVTNKPITTVIETHDDTDHINGLYTTPNADKLKIIAMEDNWKQQWTTFKWTERPKANCPQSPLPPAPNVIIRQDRVATTIDGVRFVFHHYGPSHTGHDLIIELPDYKVAFVGDVVFDKDLFPNHPGLPPEDHKMFWKSEKRGTPLGMFHNIDELLKLDVTGYIGGHSSAIMSKTTIKQIRDDVKADYDKEAAMTRAGMSLDEIRKAVGDDKYPEPRGGCIAYVDLPWFAYTETKRDMEELKDRGTIK